jgi:hypothetical protein
VVLSINILVFSITTSDISNIIPREHALSAIRHPAFAPAVIHFLEYKKGVVCC